MNPLYGIPIDLTGRYLRWPALNFNHFINGNGIANFKSYLKDKKIIPNRIDSLNDRKNDFRDRMNSLDYKKENVFNFVFFVV